MLKCRNMIVGLGLLPGFHGDIVGFKLAVSRLDLDLYRGKSESPRGLVSLKVPCLPGEVGISPLGNGSYYFAMGKKVGGALI